MSSVRKRGNVTGTCAHRGHAKLEGSQPRSSSLACEVGVFQHVSRTAQQPGAVSENGQVGEAASWTVSRSCFPNARLWEPKSGCQQGSGEQRGGWSSPHGGGDMLK